MSPLLAPLRPLLCVAIALLAPAALAAGSSAKKSHPAKPGTLQVEVVVPPTWRPLLEDDIADAFVDRVREAFDQRGYKGDIDRVDSYDEPDHGCCLLTINLSEWRMNRVGSIDCTFSASLQAEDHIRDLGVFNGLSFNWNGPGRFGLARSYEEAAQDALRQLYDHLAATKLVPGITKS